MVASVPNPACSLLYTAFGVFTKAPGRLTSFKILGLKVWFWAAIISDILSLSNYMPNSISVAVCPSSSVAFMSGGGGERSVTGDFFAIRDTSQKIHVAVFVSHSCIISVA